MDHLSFQLVTLVRGLRVLVQDANFELRAGEVMVVRGENGAGKSTLLRAAAGLLKPFSGKVLVSASRLSFLGHELALKPHLTPKAYVGAQALTAWGLDALADLPLSDLSAGQKKRVALARACDPARALWLLDEPFANLDAAQRHKLQDRLHAHAANGGSALLSAHEGGVEGRTLRLEAGRAHVG